MPNQFTISPDMPEKNTPVWIEVIPCLCGDSICITYDSDENVMPAIEETKEKIQADIDDMNNDMVRQVADGERDADDLYELDNYPALATFDGETVHILDEETLEVVSTFQWTNSL